jgi:hypothetical protein
MRSSFSIVLLLLAAVLHTANANTKLAIKNKSSKIATINWVNHDTREAVFFVEIAAGASFACDTFVGHEFQFVERPNDRTGACEEETCKVSNFVVSENNHQSKYNKSGFPFHPVLVFPIIDA